MEDRLGGFLALQDIVSYNREKNKQNAGETAHLIYVGVQEAREGKVSQTDLSGRASCNKVLLY